MPTVLAVDLAARLSAVILRGAGGEVLHQFDSRNKPSLVFCQEVSTAALDADLIVVEDVPYGISNQAMTKPVLRIQGALCAYLIARNRLDRTWFVPPALWMHDYPGVQLAPKGYSKASADAYRIEQARMYAEQAGYTPPDLVGEYIARTEAAGKKVLKKDTNPLEKSQTDYVSAYLMSEWARGHDFSVPHKTVQAAHL